MRNSIAIIAFLTLALAGGILPATASDVAEMTPAPELSAAPIGEPAEVLAITLAAPFTLDLHQAARLGEVLVIRFEAVAEDSRCPSDVVCVWEGNAQASISAGTSPQQAVALALNTNPGFATEARYADFTIRLVGLDPYPRTDVESPEPYRATLVVLTDAMNPGSQPETWSDQTADGTNGSSPYRRQRDAGRSTPG